MHSLQYLLVITITLIALEVLAKEAKWPEGGAANTHCPQNVQMNDTLRENYTNMHNYRRGQLAKGLVAKKDGNFLPQAKDMIKLKWDCQLEKEAIEKVSGCPQDVSNAKLKGELRHRVPVKDVQNYEDGIRNAVHNWWRVVRFYDGIGMRAIFKEKHVGQPIATFTQMAWAKTSKLGCAIGICPPASKSNEQEYVVICRYNPAGNTPDQNVYIPNPPACSACPPGYSCDKSLCAAN